MVILHRITKKLMKSFFLILLINLTSIALYSQENLDSLWKAWQNTSLADTSRLEALNTYNWYGYIHADPDSGIYFSELAEKFASEKKLTKYVAKALNYKGNAYVAKSEFETGLTYLNQSLAISKKENDSLGMGKTYLAIGNVFVYKSAYQLALDYYDKCANLFNKIGLLEGQASVFNNMGVIAEYKGDNKLAIEYYHKSFNVCKELNDLTGQATSYLNIGVVYEGQGLYDKAFDYYKKSLIIDSTQQDYIGMSKAYNNLGNITFYQGHYRQSVAYYRESLKIVEKLKNKKGIAVAYGNLGAIYKKIGEPQKALEFYTKSLELAVETQEKEGIAYAYNSIGSIYELEKQYDKAISFYEKSLTIRQEIKSEVGEAEVLLSIASILLKYEGFITSKKLTGINEIPGDDNFQIKKNNKLSSKNLELAEQYFKKSLAYYEAQENSVGKAKCYLGLGVIYGRKADPKSILNLEKSFELAQSINNIELINAASEQLYLYYKKKGDTQKSLAMLELFVQINDSLNSDLNKNELYRQEYKASYEQQAALDSIKHMESQLIREVEIAQQKNELKNRTLQQYFLFGGLAIMILFLVYVINKNKEVKAQKVEVEKQKNVAEQQKEIAEQQKEVLGIQHQEITDSINYALHLQQAVLPSPKDMDACFKQNFILFKPKNVVSGDFYWTYKKGNISYLAVVDCTGHGVPGAFMTIVANSLLNEIMNTNRFTPKEIIEELHQLIKVRVGGSSTALVRDSMDLGLLAYNTVTNEVKFAGTHTNLYRVRNATLELYKGSNATIGYQSFLEIEEQTFTVQENDMLYMHSDGFPDQKGGAKQKKFYYRPLRKKLEEISLENLKKQEQIMTKVFNDWKGDLEQFDDVCMVGVRI